MSELMKKIEYAFANLEEGKAMPVSGVEGAAEGWLLREKQGVMIAALPSDYERVFDETFSGICMRTSSRWIDDNKRNLIIIESDQFENRRPFARLCEDFLSVENAQGISKDPKDWWHKWKTLMGNSSVNKMPYAVIGELLVLLKLIQSGENPNWSGPDGATHDLELAASSIEVKSTIERVDETVTISNQHQLSPGKGKTLHLIFCRFEPERGDLSIDALAKSLVAAGFDKEQLEGKLKKLGYPVGRTSREKTYDLLEAEVYPVDEIFPRIVPQSFKGNICPAGVVKMVYDISLSNLDRIQLDDFLSNVG
jgi:hypothetical protein